MKTWKEHAIARRWVRLASLVGAVGAIAASGLVSSTAIAQVLVPASNESVTLTDDGIRFEGTAAGAYGLMRLAGRDRRRRLCLGYGTEEPNHVLVLSEAVSRLSMSVVSEGDTTLLIEGPRGVDCNDNYRRNSRDAAVRDGQWPAGTYRIWVGSFEKGDRLNYKLLVSPPGNEQ